MSEAVKLNPYVDVLFDLRAITRIRQNKYEQAIADYNNAIRLNPQERNYLRRVHRGDSRAKRERS